MYLLVVTTLLTVIMTMLRILLMTVITTIILAYSCYQLRLAVTGTTASCRDPTIVAM